LDVTDSDQVRATLADEADITFVDKATSISRLLAEVRRPGHLWIALAFLLALSVLATRYGVRRGALLLLPTAIGVAWAPVLAAWVGVPASVFGHMALLLVLGVGVNYSIFLWEGGARSRSALAGVIASCLTTLLSFGLLAFCSMPALSWLGTTLSFGILVSFLLTPLALTAPAPHATDATPGAR
jgi:predicted exporter